MQTTEDMLAKAFNTFNSFAKSRIVKNKRNMKANRFGFVSFTDPLVGARALRQMNGKYIGNRPCMLKRSNHEDRNAPDTYKKRQAALMNPLDRVSAKKKR